MKMFNANDTVIYTDADGRLIDTFVIFDTDATSGLTHINHQNLKVPTERLVLHPITVEKYHLPMRDAFSFELFKTLRDKYSDDKQAVERKLKVKSTLGVLAQAS